MRKLQEAVANFHPTSQDLDYPGKLQHLAEQTEPAVTSAESEQTPLVSAAVANGDSSSLVRLVHSHHVAGLIHAHTFSACTAEVVDPEN